MLIQKPNHEVMGLQASARPCSTHCGHPSVQAGGQTLAFRGHPPSRSPALLEFWLCTRFLGVVISTCTEARFSHSYCWGIICWLIWWDSGRRTAVKFLEIIHVNMATQTNTRRRIIFSICSVLLCWEPRVPKLNQGNRLSLVWRVLRTRYGGISQITSFYVFVLFCLLSGSFFSKSRDPREFCGDVRTTFFH